MNNRRIALVTGGNSGIGYATAKVLKESGDQVIITGRRKEAVDKAAAELGVVGLVADQSIVGDIERLAAHISREYGQLDILFINAGITGSLGPIDAASEAMYDQVMDINVKGAYFTLSRMIPILKNGASVVYLSSIVAHMSGPGSSIYSSSKAALNSIMKTAAAELVSRNIRVNAVSPGPTKTEVLNKSGFTGEALDNLKQAVVDRVPMKRMGEAEDVAKMVAYLCSDAAGFITGSEFVIDGGMLLK